MKWPLIIDDVMGIIIYIICEYALYYKYNLCYFIHFHYFDLLGELSKEADQDHKIQKYICSKPLQQTLKKIKKFSKRSKVTFSSEILVDEVSMYNTNMI